MAMMRGVRIVKPGGSHADANDVQVYDLESGEQISQVYAVAFDIDARRNPMTVVRITADMPFEYEGPAEIQGPEAFKPTVSEVVRELRRQAAMMNLTTSSDGFGGLVLEHIHSSAEFESVSDWLEDSLRLVPGWK